MEDFTYVDRFATIGIEYLLTILFLLVLIFFWWWLNKPARSVAEKKARMVPAIREWFRIPEGFFFHRGHGWARPEGGEVVRVGLDDFAQKLVGKIRTIVTPDVGSRVVQGEPAWSLVLGSKSFPMLSPVDGEVLEVNEAVRKAPERIYDDPYGDAWLMKVRVPAGTSDLENLLEGDPARQWMHKIQNELLARTRGEPLGVLCQDGGEPVFSIARSIDPENWEELLESFLLTSRRDDR